MAIADLGVNFFLFDKDIGQQRSKVILSRLQELNPICSIGIGDNLDEEAILNHSSIVVTTPIPLNQLIKLNEFARSNNVSFLIAYSCGVSGSIFVDHGVNHIVNDKDGDKPIQKIIVEIKSVPTSSTTSDSTSNANETLIRYETPEGQPAVSISSGYFEITEVEGIAGINHGVYEVKRLDSDPVKSVRILSFPLTPNDSYVAGGLITEKKVPESYPMESLAVKIKSPGSTFSFPQTLVLTDLINFGSEYQQHVAFVSSLLFYERYGYLVKAHDETDINNFFEISKQLIADKFIELDEGLYFIGVIK